MQKIKIQSGSVIRERNAQNKGIELNKPCIYTFRVRYSDTDQMGFMHHSCYFMYYENARWELFRSFGFAYEDIEKEGLILPVVNAIIDYKKAALYDQLISIDVRLKTYKGARLVFDYRMTNEKSELINKAEITVACVNKEKGTACLPYGRLKTAVEGISNPIIKETTNRRNLRHGMPASTGILQNQLKNI
jgi:acyl-CoA thioester hydrolase